MSRSSAVCTSPTSALTPRVTDRPPPGTRSRTAPKVRARPVPMACTPTTSRAASPAIFSTTPSAMVVRPRTAGSAAARLGAVAVGPAHPAGAGDSGPGAPMGALPHVPVRIGAGFEAGVDEPLPVTAERLRAALWSTARDLLGIEVAVVDLTVTGLLE